MHVLRLVPLLLLFLETVCCQEESVSNTNLDILFLLDQQRTRLALKYSDVAPRECDAFIPPDFCSQVFDYFENSSNYRMAYNGVTEWVQSFFDKDGSSDAQFAMIFSCDKTGGIMHYFNGNNFKKMIPNLLEDGKNGIKIGCRKNFAWMMELANKEVFTADRGHRFSSAAIVIVLSDCVHEPLSPSELYKTLAEFNYFFRVIKGQVYFVCYVEYKKPFRDYFKADIKQFMNETLQLLSTNNQTNHSMIYLDGSNVNVGQRLDQLLPKRSRVASVDCNQTLTCGICSGNGTCFAHCNWTTNSWPTGNGTNCTKQESSFRSCKCPTATPQPTEPPSYWSIVLGFGILLLVIVGLVIIVFCIRARSSRNKRTKNKATAMQKAPEKKAGIAVDLSREHSTTNTIGKGSNSKSVSMVGSKAKSVSMKGSVVKSMSKRGSLVKSLAKTGSVNKPTCESGKSVSKPKREEAKSKASKSVAGKNVKSIGISKKSVTSKSSGGKSRMKSKKPAVS